MALSNEEDRKASLRNISTDLSWFERELQVRGKDQVVVSGSYKDIPLHIQGPEFNNFNLRVRYFEITTDTIDSLTATCFWAFSMKVLKVLVC